jgi:hypothetical protein
MRGLPQFCRAQSARMRAQVICDTRQNRFPRAPLRGACGVVDPARSGMTPAFRLSTRKETTMIDLYDHIQELRRELKSCRFTRRERAAVEAELAKALNQQAERDRALDEALAALDRAVTLMGTAA